MKKIYGAVILSAVMLTACHTGREPMRQLPPEHTTAKTSSTYTGTTVDFIHVETGSRPRRPTNEYDLPEFPDMNAENPFDEEFYNMFTGAMDRADGFPETVSVSYPEQEFPSAPYESAEMPFSQNIRMTEQRAESETSAPPDAMPSEVTRVVTVTAALPEYDLPEMGTITTPAQTAADSDDIRDTFPSAETFDIMDYMPDAGEYPPFTTIDIRDYFD